MTVQELLAPRYKVIADYPCSMFEIGQVIEVYESAMTYGVEIDSGDYLISEKICLKDYPHLFKKLEWWEDRKPEELPEYVKWNYDPKIDNTEMDGLIRKVEGWISNNLIAKIEGQYMATRFYLPSTKEEYDQYLLSQNGK